MEPPKPSSFDSYFNSPRQAHIYNRLHNRVGSGPASFYLDACRIMQNQPAFHTTTHLVGHLLREVESSLRKVLIPVVERAGSSIISADEQRRLRIQDKMQRLDMSTTAAVGQSLLASSSGEMRDVEGALDKLLQILDLSESLEGEHKTQIKAILRFFEIPETDADAKAWLKQAHNFSRYAHRDSLHDPRPVDDEEFQDFWFNVEAILDFVLTKLETRYLHYFDALDEILANPRPTKKDVKRLRNEIPNTLVAFNYFFENASKVWLESLAKADFFKSPPPLNGEATLPWPESNYLVRMAEFKPNEVLEIVSQMPKTQNPYILDDLCDIALTLPPQLAVQLTSEAKLWIESSNHRLLPTKIGELIARFAQHDEVDCALELTRTLLALEASPQKKPHDSQILPSIPEPRARFDAWLYGEILKRHIPHVVKVAREPALEILCDLLESAVRFSQPKAILEGPEDNSSMWQPRIDENRSSDLRNTLVSAVRDAAHFLGRSDPNSLPVAVEILNRHPYRIFQRLTLYLLWNNLDIAAELVAQGLTKREYFDVGLPEYFFLLQQAFGQLNAVDQDTILRWISEGPKDSDWISDKRRWQLSWLAPIKTVLNPQWKRLVDELVLEFGEPSTRQYESYGTRILSGPTSPRTDEELALMSVEEIVSFLRTWQPSDEFLGPSQEGLGRKLTALAIALPERFSEQALLFRNLDPTYVRALIYGFHEAIKEKKAIMWQPVLGLCHWVVKQPRDTSERSANRVADRDPDWGWTRGQIANLLNSGFQLDIVPFDLRQVAWDVLEPITDDPDPTPEYEALYIQDNMSPAHHSINTTRGKAMHAVIHYSAWCKKHLEAATDERVSKNFDAMPEVRDVLEHHLENDLSLAIRAVYGWKFPTLVWLDLEWIAQHVEKIFPSSEGSDTLYGAAWEAYILYNHPYRDVFALLKNEYRRAIDRLGAFEPRRLPTEDPEHHLAGHLMTLYWAGILELNDPGGLLEQFYERASDEILSHALSTIGQSLMHTEELVEPQAIDRLQTLWTYRLNRTREKPYEHAKELDSFVWWFISGKFDNDWALAQLSEVLQLTGNVDTSVYQLVVEQLAALSSEIPLAVVKCLSFILAMNRNAWGMSVWREDIRTVLSNVLRSDNAEAQRVAQDIINRLAAQGNLDFRGLINGSASSQPPA